MRGLLFLRCRLLWLGPLLVLILIAHARAETVRIMPLGDSITYGFWGYGDTRPAAMITGYRQALYLALQEAGHPVEFVGTLSAGGDAIPAFTPRHEGHGGWRDDQVAANIFAWLRAHPADIVLLHIGTNGLDPSPKDVEVILKEIDRFDPDTIVLLARIINRRTYSAMTSEFNDNVEAMAKERIRAGGRIVLVNMEDALDYSKDMNDNLHPNQAGYDKMAKVWLATLLQLLPLPTSPQLTPMPTINAWLGQELRLQLRATGSPAPAFSLIDPPNGMAIHPQSGLLTWRPVQEENRTVTTEARNEVGSHRLELKLRVREAPLCPESISAVWPLDEEIPPFFELFHGTPPGSCVGKCPLPVAGRIGDGQAFVPGRGIDLPLGAQAPAGSFSVSFWLRRSATLPGGENLLSGESGSASWFIELADDGLPLVRWQAAGAEEVWAVGANPLDDGDWHHLLAAFDFSTGELRLYVDGEEDGKSTALTGGAAATTLLHLGRSDRAGTADFAGELDEVALFAEALPRYAAELIHARGAVGLGVCSYPQELPKITSKPTLHGTVGKDWSYQVTATGLPQPIFALLKSPAGMSLTVDDGQALWKPTSPGTFPVTIRASNINGQTEQQFNLEIEPPPTPPTFRTTAASKVVVDENYRYVIAVDGYPTPALTLASAPLNMTLQDGQLHWLPTKTGDFPVLLRAVNAHGQAEQSFTIRVEPPAAPPAIASIPVLVSTAGLPYRYQVATLGYPQPRLLLITAPEGMVIDGEQILWTPTIPGGYAVQLAAINDSGRAEQSFMVEVHPPPQAPRILSVPALTAPIAQPYRYVVVSEGYPPPAISLLDAPPGMVLDGDQLLWRPTTAGRYAVHLRAQSSSGLAEQNFVIEVSAQRAWHGRLDNWWRKIKIRWRKWF